MEKRADKVGYLREVVVERISRLRPIEESEKSGIKIKAETSEK